MAGTPQGAALRQIHHLFSEGSVAGLSDAQLLDRFLARRDGVAFAALVERHGPVVLATCRSILRDPDAAEDAFQATFLVLVKKAGSIRDREALGAWLHRVSRRVAIQANASDERRRWQEQQAGFMRSAGPSDGTLAPALSMVLHEEIDRLPDRYRLPLVLCHLEELDHAQAARQLHWSERTLRRRLAEGRAAPRPFDTPGTDRGRGGWLAGSMHAPPPAAVPPAWAAKAVAAATGAASTSLTAAAWTAGVLTVPSWARLKGAATLVLALGAVVSIGLLVMTAERPLRNPPTPAANQAPARQKPEPQPKNVPDEQREFRGLVLDSQGRPFTGAALILEDLREEVGFKGNIVSPRAVRAGAGRTAASGSRPRGRSLP